MIGQQLWYEPWADILGLRRNLRGTCDLGGPLRKRRIAHLHK
jgi:hypothetical protein